MARWIAHAADCAAPAAPGGAKAGDRAAAAPSGAFARMLEDFAAPAPRRDAPVDRAGATGSWRADGIYAVHLPARIDPHALVWRAHAPVRPLVAAPAALQYVAGAWAEILASADGPAPDPVRGGMAVFDSDGLRAEYAFLWRFGAGQTWRPDPDADRGPEYAVRGRAAPWAARGALDPVASSGRTGLAENCGRCRRHALGRGDILLPLAFCRFDCLEPGAPT